MTERVFSTLAVSFLAGVLYGRYGSIWIPAFLAAGTLMLMIGLLQSFGRQALLSAGIRTVLCLAVFLAGSLRMEERQEEQRAREAFWKDGDNLTVQGWIAKKDEKSKITIYYLTDTLISSEDQVIPGNGVLIYSSNKTYQPGSKLLVQGRYESFQLPRNQGNFNEKEYYQSKQIEFKIVADQERLLPQQKSYIRWLARLREKLKQVITQSAPKKEAGVLSAMTLGEKSLLEEETKTLYQQAGISHILAISGLHVSVFGMGIFGLLHRLWLSRKAAAVSSFLVVYSFGLLSGMEISTLRAVLMFGIAMWADAQGYAYDSITALSLSGLVQLWSNPFLVGYAGFLFSYAAVLGVTGVAQVLRSVWNARRELWREKREQEGREQEDKEHGSGAQEEIKDRKDSIGKKAGKRLLDTLYISTCIQSTTLPLNLYFYYEMPVYGIFNNACVLPFMGMALFFAMGGALTGLLCPALAPVLLKPAVWILQGNEQICNFFLGLPGAVRITGQPPCIWMLLYYAALTAGVWMIKRRKRLYPLAGICLALWCVIVCRPKPDFEVDVLDMGQGDGIFIQAETGEGFFVDGGSSDVKKAGQYRILPFLKYRGIPQISFWMVSHGDADHVSGLEEILEAGYPIQYLVLSQYMVRDEAWQELCQKAEQAGSQVIYVLPGDAFGTERTRFEVCYPCEPGQTDRNAASMALWLFHEGFTGILTGDMGSREEQGLLEQGLPQRILNSGVTLYKAAHHGSNGSNSLPFLQALAPEAAVVSCGKENRYGHPGKAAVERMKKTCRQICYTMDSGQICLRWEEGKQRVRTYIPEQGE